MAGPGIDPRTLVTQVRSSTTDPHSPNYYTTMISAERGFIYYF